VFFTKNGTFLGATSDRFPTSQEKIEELEMFPTIGMSSIGAKASINFGQKPFVFDFETLLLPVTTFHESTSNQPDKIDRLLPLAFMNERLNAIVSVDPGNNLVSTMFDLGSLKYAFQLQEFSDNRAGWLYGATLIGDNIYAFEDPLVVSNAVVFLFFFHFAPLTRHLA